MPAIDEELLKGKSLQEAGDWASAFACFSRIVEANPRHAGALYGAGVSLARLDRLDESADFLRRCLDVEPRFTDALRALGALCLARSDPARALPFLLRARDLNRREAGIHHQLGLAYQGLHLLDEAAASYQAALRLRPTDSNLLNLLGNLRRLQGRPQEAARAYERAVRADPSHAEAWYNLGTTRQIQENPGKAAEAYRRALALRPANPAAENNLGLVLKAEGHITDSIAAFRRALALKPDHAVAMVNLGAVLQHENRLSEAVSILSQALVLNPGDARAYGNLGNAYLAQNRPREAVAAYEKALSIDPSFSGNVYNIALARLLMGDLARGWVGYESRLDTAEHAKKYPCRMPRWKAGDSISGRRLLVYAEQGLGDTLQFIRFVPLLEPLGAAVTVQVPSSLKPLLLGAAGRAAVIGTRDPLPEHDLQCSLLSLPRHLGTTAESIPRQVPYLAPPPGKFEQWKQVFSKAAGPKVGLVWAGNPKHQFDHNRSLPLRELAPITEGAPAHFFSLQKQVRPTDLEVLRATPRITDLSPYLSTFNDTAAVVSALDLVITVDTSVAHLAGALGKNTWVLLSHAPDWRWLMDRSDSPWYPTVRLFRQAELGQWAPVMRTLKEALAGPLA